jgi:hypothetical protein
LEKILLEYEQCHCSKVNKKVTITSMVIKESNEEATPDGDNKQAFDCNQKENCGVLTILGKERLFDWAECTNPKLLTGSVPVD